MLQSYDPQLHEMLLSHWQGRSVRLLHPRDTDQNTKADLMRESEACVTGRTEGLLTKVSTEVGPECVAPQPALSFPTVSSVIWDHGQVWWFRLVIPAL